MSTSEESDGHERTGPLPAVIAMSVFAVYTVLALRLHQQFETRGYDLGIFGQYAKNFAHLDAPTSQYRAKGAEMSLAGPNLFGDHVSPILAVLGPIYRLVPHIETLLVIQAGLVAGSVFVVARFAVRRLGARSGAAIGSAYALSWGLQQLVGFDFHEVAFELPLISLAVVAYLEGRLRAAALWAVSLVLVKEDMGLTVFVFGLLVWRDDRRVARVLCVVGPVLTAVALFVIVPHYASGPLGRLGDGAQDGGGLGELAAHPWRIPRELLWPPVKLATVAMVLLPTCFLALRSRVVVLVVPTLLWRFTANTPNYWGIDFHYSAVLMPIVFLAMVDVVDRARRGELEAAERIGGVVGAIIGSVVRFAPRIAVAVGVVGAAVFPLNHMLRPGFWGTSAHVAALERAVGKVPGGVRVAASGHVVPHLVDRATVYPLLTTQILDCMSQRVDWVVVDTADGDFATPEGKATLRAVRDDGFTDYYSDDGVVVMSRDGGLSSGRRDSLRGGGTVCTSG